MMTLTETSANRKMTVQLKATLSEVLAEALRRGFHGSVGVELDVQDGTIQNIRRKVEQIQR